MQSQKVRASMLNKKVWAVCLLFSFAFIKTDDYRQKDTTQHGHRHVTKSVILAAGLGTRFLPLTKSIPKEMLPIINKPAMQYIVEESLEAGIKNFFMVTSSSKYILENYFDIDKGLDAYLKEKNKSYMTASVDKIICSATFTYVRQPKPLGTAHAVSMAKHCIGKEYFAVILPDDLFFEDNNVLETMISISEREHASVIAVQEVPIEKISSYGIVKVKKEISSNIFEISQLIEKPKPEEAPSNMAIVGRYILSHTIFDSIEKIEPGSNGELQLTDAITHMMQHGERVLVYKIDGHRYDTGNPLGWIKTIIGASLKDPYYGPKVKDFILKLSL